MRKKGVKIFFIQKKTVILQADIDTETKLIFIIIINQVY